jgi:hypothetical protein
MFQAKFVVSVQVLNISLLKQVDVDQLTAVGSNCQVFKAETIFILWMLDTHDNVFDSDSEFSIVIISWLV